MDDHYGHFASVDVTFLNNQRRERQNIPVAAHIGKRTQQLVGDLQVCTVAVVPDPDPFDPRVFYDTSSYGPAAIEAMARRVGPDQLVYGSDRPVIEPYPTGRDALLQHNGARIVTPARVIARA